MNDPTTGPARTWTPATRTALRSEIVTLLGAIPGYHAALLADPLTAAIEAVIATPYATGGPVNTGALQYAVDSACDPTPFSGEKLQAPIAKMVALFTATDTVSHQAAPEQPTAAVLATVPSQSTTAVFPHDPTWEQDLTAIIGQAEADLDAGVDEDVAYEKFLAALNGSTPQGEPTTDLPVVGPATAAASDDAYMDAVLNLIIAEGEDALITPGADAKIEAAIAAHAAVRSVADRPATRALRQDLDDYTDATTLHDDLTGKNVGPFLDQQTIDDVSARPDAYFGDGTTVPDRDGFLIELWIDTSGWNEGHDMVRAPILTAYVTTAHEADDVMTAIATVPHAHAWTGFEARMRVAPSTARQRKVSDIVGEWATWIVGPGPTYVIP